MLKLMLSLAYVWCSGFVSGSAAQEVKFWEWAVTTEEGSQARQLTINNTRTLKMTEDVLCVRISPNGMPQSLHNLLNPRCIS